MAEKESGDVLLDVPGVKFNVPEGQLDGGPEGSDDDDDNMGRFRSASRRAQSR